MKFCKHCNRAIVWDTAAMAWLHDGSDRLFCEPTTQATT